MFIQIVIKGRILELVLCQNLLLNPLLCLSHSSSFYSSSTVTPRTVQYFSETTKRVHTWQLIQILVWVKILQCRRQELSSSITNSRRFIFNTNWILTILIVIRILAWLFTHVLPVLPPSQTHTHVYTPRLTFILSAHLSFLPVIKYRLINVRVTLRSGPVYHRRHLRPAPSDFSLIWSVRKVWEWRERWLWGELHILADVNGLPVRCSVPRVLEVSLRRPSPPSRVQDTEKESDPPPPPNTHTRKPPINLPSTTWSLSNIPPTILTDTYIHHAHCPSLIYCCPQPHKCTTQIEHVNTNITLLQILLNTYFAVVQY